jgi:hypothetical protein
MLKQLKESGQYGRSAQRIALKFYHARRRLIAASLIPVVFILQYSMRHLHTSMDVSQSISRQQEVSAPLRIGILSVSTPERVEMYQLATNSKTCYAMRHNYELIIDTNAHDGSRTPNPWWRKVEVLQKYLHAYDWIFLMDADTLFTNYSVKLEWFLPQDNNVNLVMTDHNVGINNVRP